MSSKSTYYINSLSVDLNKYGSKNNISIKAIGVFNFDINDMSEFDFVNLKFPNFVNNRTEEVVIPYSELRIRIQIRDSELSNLFVLWLLPDGKLYNVTHLGAEGEWFFICGGMGKGTQMDFTKFLINFT